jgi:hypothetical protein
MNIDLAASAALVVLFYLLLPWILTGVIWWIAGIVTEEMYQ